MALFKGVHFSFFSCFCAILYLLWVPLSGCSESDKDQDLLNTGGLLGSPPVTPFTHGPIAPCPITRALNLNRARPLTLPITLRPLPFALYFF